MDLLADGFVVLYNGVRALFGVLWTPVLPLIVLQALSLAWMAICKVDDLDRDARKPNPNRH